MPAVASRTSSIAPTLLKREFALIVGKDYSYEDSGVVVSLFTGGAFVGAFFGGPSGDYLGRRLTIVVGCVVFLLGGGLQTGAQKLEEMYAGRWFAGVGVGLLTMVRLQVTILVHRLTPS